MLRFIQWIIHGVAVKVAFSDLTQLYHFQPRSSFWKSQSWCGERSVCGCHRYDVRVRLTLFRWVFFQCRWKDIQSSKKLVHEHQRWQCIDWMLTGWKRDWRYWQQLHWTINIQCSVPKYHKVYIRPLWRLFIYDTAHKLQQNTTTCRLVEVVWLGHNLISMVMDHFSIFSYIHYYNLYCNVISS